MLGRLSRPSHRGPAHRRAVAGAALALVALTAGCTADAPATTPADDAPVLQPGAPGEGNRTLSPDEVAEAGEPEFNEADVAFMQMMIPHHAQAITMAGLAPDQAADAQVKALAARIKAAQGPEILMMASWLSERNMQVPTAAEDPSEWDHADHGHHGMSGMLSEAEMDRLARARGAAFDRLFLEGMIDHHQGAVDMAADVATDGADVVVGEVAADVSVTQLAEIGRMRDLLADAG